MTAPLTSHLGSEMASFECQQRWGRNVRNWPIAFHHRLRSPASIAHRRFAARRIAGSGRRAMAAAAKRLAPPASFSASVAAHITTMGGA